MPYPQNFYDAQLATNLLACIDIIQTCKKTIYLKIVRCITEPNILNMKLTDIATMTDEGREYIICEFAIPVLSHYENSSLFILYQLDYFFAEKVINIHSGVTTSINFFDSSSPQLDQYLEDIKLPLSA